MNIQNTHLIFGAMGGQHMDTLFASLGGNWSDGEIMESMELAERHGQHETQGTISGMETN